MSGSASQMTLTAAALLTFAGGALVCFFGGRLLKVALGLVGFFFGASLAAFVVAMLSGVSSTVTLVAMIVGGLVGAVVMVWALKVGVFLVGALAGGLIGAVIAANLSATAALLVLLGCGLVGGVLALQLQKVVFGVATAIVGAAMMVSASLEAFLGARRAQEVIEGVSRGLERLDSTGWIVLGAWLLLALVGAVVQLGSRKKSA